MKPGEMTLHEWRGIYRGGVPSLDPACLPGIERAAAAVSEIVVRGEPVYGINTGFGKLANVHIPPGDLAALQRNIVLSHSAGTGAPVPVAIAR
ncbi:MAG: aromatic amino acid lyase, partial [Alphaproteobacteria bacterium]|nr:aromatic amino acid lyase [Alphaproteobacteria bacterium]